MKSTIMSDDDVLRLIDIHEQNFNQLNIAIVKAVNICLLKMNPLSGM